MYTVNNAASKRKKKESHKSISYPARLLRRVSAADDWTKLYATFMTYNVNKLFILRCFFFCLQRVNIRSAGYAVRRRRVTLTVVQSDWIYQLDKLIVCNKKNKKN